jgi:hypothetical protein
VTRNLYAPLWQEGGDFHAILAERRRRRAALRAARCSIDDPNWVSGASCPQRAAEAEIYVLVDIPMFAIRLSGCILYEESTN